MKQLTLTKRVENIELIRKARGPLGSPDRQMFFSSKSLVFGILLILAFVPRG